MAYCSKCGTGIQTSPGRLNNYHTCIKGVVKMKTLFRSPLIAIISIAFIGACAISSGTKISENQVSQIEKGVTTKADISRMFGNPASTSVDANGNAMWMFEYAEEQYIPGSKGRGKFGEQGQRLIIKFTGDKVNHYQFINR
jgi:outer membrane protein assembly factor BamE (lipoprotein component of BamABCDE complex)